ncbi:Auxin-responsive protein SAUR67 [Forsythia ovata]|uniref:Auxin-responsive protein SAUR67 n=1 Tax=Forsythia ovata TaxID=205694 RepID=A0ABD1QL33_9LAMI
MARQWQKFTAIRQKRITFPGSTKDEDKDARSSLSTVDKGHFAIYTCDQRRFVIPLAYLEKPIFRELLKMAEEEYGLPGNGPITLPCDAIFMEYAVSLIRRNTAREMERALLVSMTSNSCCCSLSSHIQQGQVNQNSLVCAF